MHWFVYNIIYQFLLRDYVKLSKHIYFCEIVNFKTFLKTKENVDLAKVIGFNLITKTILLSNTN